MKTIHSLNNHHGSLNPSVESCVKSSPCWFLALFASADYSVWSPLYCARSAHVLAFLLRLGFSRGLCTSLGMSRKSHRRCGGPDLCVRSERGKIKASHFSLLPAQSLQKLHAEEGDWTLWILWLHIQFIHFWGVSFCSLTTISSSL